MRICVMQELMEREQVEWEVALGFGREAVACVARLHEDARAGQGAHTRLRCLNSQKRRTWFERQSCESSLVAPTNSCLLACLLH